MSKSPRKIWMTPELATLIKKQGMSQSDLVNTALKATQTNADCLLWALKKRLSRPIPSVVESNTERVTLSLEDSLIAMAQVISDVTQLSMEQVVRLSIEAYIFGLAPKDAHESKESNDATRPLLAAQERPNH